MLDAGEIPVEFHWYFTGIPEAFFYRDEEPEIYFCENIIFLEKQVIFNPILLSNMLSKENRNMIGP